MTGKKAVWWECPECHRMNKHNVKVRIKGDRLIPYCVVCNVNLIKHVEKVRVE